MCEYCSDEIKIMLEKEVNNNGILYWCCVGKVLDIEDLDSTKRKLIVFVDRGFLRLANPDDCGCMDHGENIKINYCPMCGDKVMGIL